MAEKNTWTNENDSKRYLFTHTYRPEKISYQDLKESLKPLDNLCNKNLIDYNGLWEHQYAKAIKNTSHIDYALENKTLNTKLKEK